MSNKFYLIEIDENNAIIRFVESYEMIDGLIELTEDEYHYGQGFLNFNLESRKFYNPIHPIMDLANQHEELTKTIHENVETTSLDSMINMDMILELDYKINLILERLGIDY